MKAYQFDIEHVGLALGKRKGRNGRVILDVQFDSPAAEKEVTVPKKEINEN